MEKIFSRSWKSSSQPRKQRKYLYRAPLHVLRKMMGAPLSKELRKRHHRRNFPVRKGDAVVIMRGGFKKKEGRVTRVDLKKGILQIEGIQRIRKDGSKIAVSFHPSKIMIKELFMEDKERIRTNEHAPQN